MVRNACCLLVTFALCQMSSVTLWLFSTPVEAHPPTALQLRIWGNVRWPASSTVETACSTTVNTWPGQTWPGKRQTQRRWSAHGNGWIWDVPTKWWLVSDRSVHISFLLLWFTSHLTHFVSLWYPLSASGKATLFLYKKPTVLYSFSTKSLFSLLLTCSQTHCGKLKATFAKRSHKSTTDY